MILGLGLDLYDVRRMERELRKQDPAFVRALFGPAEIDDGSRSREPARHYAACFAAKEAVFKALAIDAGGPRWRDMEVRHGTDGRFRVTLHGLTRQVAERLGVRRILVSVAHARDVALASVILES